MLKIRKTGRFWAQNKIFWTFLQISSLEFSKIVPDQGIKDWFNCDCFVFKSKILIMPKIC